MKNIQMKHSSAKGFTLIELMIVVAIIGILAAVALPAYSDFTIRARMSEVILAASSCRTDVTEYAQTENALPGSNDVVCADNSSQFVDSVEQSDGTVIATAASDDLLGDASGSVVTLEPTFSDGRITGWTCDGTDAADRFRPSSCR